MAAQAKRLPTNVAGDFYVDSTCIDCAACRWVAPASFSAVGDYSSVTRQPTRPADILRAQMALLACPTGSIGTVEKHDLAAARAAFPEPLDTDIYYCGYHAEDSFGAASYFITHPEGNWLIDSPRYTNGLVTALEKLGGIRYLFLTHQDDVADHAQWHAHFDCERIIHARDARRSLRVIEHKIDSTTPVNWNADITLHPTPGHTAGSMCLHFRDRALFTGDHLAWHPGRRQLYAFSGACWYDWPTQIAAMETLRGLPFSWCLPGHGHPIHLPPAAMAASLEDCIAWMRTQ